MKTLKGLPTKKALIELCEKHGLMISGLDTYSRDGEFAWSSSSTGSTDDKARRIADALEAFGFSIHFRSSSYEHARRGVMRIKRLLLTEKVTAGQRDVNEESEESEGLTMV